MSKPFSFLTEAAMSRRVFIATSGMAVLSGRLFASPKPAKAAEAIGSVVNSRGQVRRRQNDIDNMLQPGTTLENNDFIVTGEDGFAELALGQDTRILMGSETEILIDSFLAEQGGILELVSGQMVFDRPEGLPKIDLTLRTTFGQIGVRGTKFFCGMSRGNYAVFVEHGLVDVQAGGVSRKVAAGEGVDIAHDSKTRSMFGGEISPIKNWGKGRIAEAYQSIGIKVD